MIVPMSAILLAAHVVPLPVAPLFVPEVSGRDVPMVVEYLALDGGQAGVLRDLVRDHAARSEAARLEAEAAVARAGPDEGEPRVSQAVRERLQDDWIARRRTLSQQARPEDRRRLEQAHRDWGRLAVGRLMDQAQGRGWSPSPRAEVVRAWLDRRAALHGDLLRDVALLLGPDRMEDWDAVTAVLRRHRPGFAQAVPGEDLDLAAIVRASVPAGEPVTDQVKGLLDAYENAWATGVVQRDEVLSEVAMQQMDAQSRQDPVEALLARRTALDAHAALAAVNARWYRIIGEALDDASRIRLQVAVNESMYPHIFLPGLPDRMARWMLDQPELDADRRRQVHQARALFGARRLRVAAQEREALELAGPRRALLPGEQAVMAHVLGPTARFAFEDTLADDMLDRVGALAQQRQGIDVAFEQRLRSIAPELAGRVPEDVLAPPEVLVEHRGGDREESPR